MSPLTHDQKHAASLTHEQRSEIRSEARKTFFLWTLVPLAMAILSFSLLAKEQLDTSHQIERDGVRSELSAIENRIHHEECLYRPFRTIIQRDPDKTARDVAQFCDPDEQLPDLMARRDRLDARLREMGAYEVRDE